METGPNDEGVQGGLNEGSALAAAFNGILPQAPGLEAIEAPKVAGSDMDVVRAPSKAHKSKLYAYLVLLRACRANGVKDGLSSCAELLLPEPPARGKIFDFCGRECSPRSPVQAASWSLQAAA